MKTCCLFITFLAPHMDPLSQRNAAAQKNTHEG